MDFYCKIQDKQNKERDTTRNLQINGTNIEEFDIEREGDELWKKCKYVGSLIDTEKNIK